jgi:hypothetical protein
MLSTSELVALGDENFPSPQPPQFFGDEKFPSPQPPQFFGDETYPSKQPPSFLGGEKCPDPPLGGIGRKAHGVPICPPPMLV